MFWAEPSNLEGWLIRFKKNKSSISSILYGVVIKDRNGEVWGRWNYSKEGALNVFNHSKWETLSLREFNRLSKEDTDIQLLEFIEHPPILRFSSPESYTDKSDIDSEFRNLNEWHWEDKNLPFMKDEFIGEETHQWKKDPRIFQELDEEQGYAYNGVQSSKKLGWRFVVDEDERDKVHYFLLSIKEDQEKLNKLLSLFDFITEETKAGILGSVIQTYWNNILFELVRWRKKIDIFVADIDFYTKFSEKLKEKRGLFNTLVEMLTEGKNSAKLSWKEGPVKEMLVDKHEDIFKLSSLPRGEEIIDYDINPLTEMNLFPSKRKDNYDYKKRNTKGDEEIIFEKGTHQDINRPETNRSLIPYGNKLSWKESIVDENPVVYEIKNVIYVLDSRYYSNQYTWYAIPLSQSDYERLDEVECLVGVNVQDLLNQYHNLIKELKENNLLYTNISNMETLPKTSLINPQIMPIQIISSLQNSLFIYVKPDEKIPLDINEAHTTLIYLEDEIEGKDRQRVIEDISNLLKNYENPLCKWSGVATFDNEDKSRVILINFENGAELYSEVLNILSNYTSVEREYDFIPHMTIDKDLSIDKLPEYEWKPSSLFIEFEKNVPAIEIEFKTGKIKESQTLRNSVDENLVKLTFIYKEEVV